MTDRARWFEALLGRTSFRIPGEPAQKFEGGRVLVTGGAGSIGSQLVRRLVEIGAGKIIVFDNAEDRLYQLSRELREAESRVEFVLGDINSVEDLSWACDRHDPETVFHAAAHKYVDFLETQVLAAVRTNVFGTRNILRVAGDYGVEAVVVVSSDKATNPSSVLGATKRVAELMVLAAVGAGNVSVVRLCNVLGTAGSLLPMVEEQIRFGSVTVTDSAATRYFITPSAAADLLLSAAGSREGGLFIPADASLLNIRTLVDRIVESVAQTEGHEVRVEVVGLRAGEKLSEELHSENEVVSSARVAGLLKLEGSKGPDIRGFQKSLDDLEAAYSKRDEGRVTEELMALVANYRPSEKLSAPVLR